MKVLLLLLCFTRAFAGDLHIGVSGGLNLSTFQVNNAGIRLLPGINARTDLGYFFNYHWAVEWSTHVKFSKFHDYLIWDTLMTAGVRYRIPETSYYVRAFAGRSPTVLYLRAREVTKGEDASRIQFLGEVYGGSLGKMFKTEKGLEWFVESSFTYQRLGNKAGVKDNGGVPEEVPLRRNNDRIEMFGVYAMIGLWVF